MEDKNLSQKEVTEFINQLDYKKLHAGINNFLFDTTEVLIEKKGHNILDLEVYTFDNFKTQLLPRIELLLVANFMDNEKGIEYPKIIYSTNSFGFLYKVNVYKGGDQFGLKFCMVRFLIELTKETFYQHIENNETPAHFLGDNGEDVRLELMQPLTIDTYEKLR